MQQRFAFPDTNTFLHYPVLDQIDWPSVLGCDLVVLVITPVVIRELNRHKDSPTSPKTRERAAAALRRLHDWSEQAPAIIIRRSVELRFVTHDPIIDFSSERLSPLIADDHLLATMIEFLHENAGSDAVLVTEDLGLKLKAAARALGKVQLPPEIRLPQELGTEEKRIRELEQELKRVRDRMPCVKLLFRNGEGRVHVPVRQPTTLAKDAIQTALTQIRKKHEKMETAKAGDNATGPFSAIAIASGISLEEIHKYNEELERYYVQYEEYLHAVEDFGNVQRRTTRLDIIAVNEGTSPAEELDIFMHFPDGFELIDQEHLPKKPATPKAPTRPKSLFEKLQETMIAPAFPSYLLRDLHTPELSMPEFRNAGRPSIRRTKSYDVRLEMGKIKHGFSEEIDPLYVIFPSFDDAGSFTIDYRLHVANLPDAVEGQLHVIVDRS